MNNRPAPFAAPTNARPAIIPEQMRLAPNPAHDPLHTRHWRIAWWLALSTIGYNLAEGLFCTLFGYHDQSLTLFGFGLNSFIECISGFGIAHMVWRSRRSPANYRDDFERTALRVTGGAFYALALGLAATAAWNLWAGQRPDTTVWGMVVATISLSVMWAMIWQKEKTGRILRSEAMLADAQ
ncbi:MAG: cation transporter, partial [Saprospiraceae bacterium]|nr:cation transporter [Saprospiraceae bacterium]